MYFYIKPQGDNCNNSLPFCTGTTYTFPSITGVPNLGQVGCLNTSPNPTWYHMQIANGGNLTIQIQQGSNDVDFICWGPFADATSACGGNGAFPSGTVQDCSYSTAPIEHCDINGAQPGEWYILLITNYSNNPGNITFTNIGGNATTNCCIIQPANAGAPFTKNCISNPNGATIGAPPSPNSNYSWAPTLGLSNPSISNPHANPDTSTTYTLTETNNFGCVFTDQVTITVDDSLPNVYAGNDLTTSCTTPTQILNGIGNGSYSWSPHTGLSTPNSSNPIANPDSTTNYTLTITGSNGCTNTDTLTIFVDKTPPFVPPINDIILNCIIDTGSFNATGGNTYSWDTPSGIINSSSIMVNHTSPAGDYIVTVTGTNGCETIDSSKLVMDTISPNVFAGPDSIVTCNTPEINLLSTGASGSPFVYQWTTIDGNILGDATTLSPLINSGGTYTLTITNTNNGCSSSDVVFIDENFTTAVDILSSSTSIDSIYGIAPYQIDFSWQGEPGTVVWDLGDNTISTDSNFTHSFSTGGAFTSIVTLTDENGCIAHDSIFIYIDYSELMFPNIFTPNGDGQNDIFKFNAKGIKSFECSILNRWGKFIYTWTDSLEGWDGKSQSGIELAEGEYYYIIKAIDYSDSPINKSGVFLLKR
jgi:gliding motility-associated-like protein